MITLDDLEQLKREVERKKEEKDKAQGALNEVLSRLKSEFGVSSLKEAKILMKKLIQEREEAYQEYLEHYEEYKKASDGKKPEEE